jgi:hypothetical protein
MLYREIIAVFYEIHTKHKYTVGRAENLWMLKLVVRTVSLRLKRLVSILTPNSCLIRFSQCIARLMTGSQRSDGSATRVHDIFINCSWVATRWQQFSTHLHTNNTQNETKQTIHRTTQKFGESAGRAPPLRVLPWHFPYNWGISMEKPQSR